MESLRQYKCTVFLGLIAWDFSRTESSPNHFFRLNEASERIGVYIAE